MPLLLAGTLLSTMSTGAVQSSEKSFVLEEIIVTARKRAENLQETLISAAAFTSLELEHRQISSTDQLGDVTPMANIAYQLNEDVMLHLNYFRKPTIYLMPPL